MNTKSMNKFDALTSLDTGDKVLVYDDSAGEAKLIDQADIVIAAVGEAIESVDESLPAKRQLTIYSGSESSPVTISGNPAEGDCALIRNYGSNLTIAGTDATLPTENMVVSGGFGWFIYHSSKWYRLAG